MELASVPALEAHNIVVSRVMRGAEEFVASPQVRLASGDILLVVGQPENLQQFVIIVGERVAVETSAIVSRIQVQWVTVSRKDIAGTKVDRLALDDRFGVQLTRVRRAGVELPPMHDVVLSLGDELRIVGLPEGLTQVRREIGDSPQQLGEPELMPIFCRYCARCPDWQHSIYLARHTRRGEAGSGWWAAVSFDRT